MNYSNHNLRTNLQEWKNRLYRSTYDQFAHQFKYLMNNIEGNLQINTLITEAVNKYPFSIEDFRKIVNSHGRVELTFENEVNQAAYCYQFLKHFETEYQKYNLHNYTYFSGRDFEDKKTKIIEDYISPIFYYFHDKLDRLNSTVYLLEKFKKRTEWFTKKEIYQSYISAEKNYEQLLEDNLRLFLFDQGIDYPFSTPLSASGRADIIGEIETDDPLIIEIKIFDRSKGYGKDRIKDGFSQVVKYANDYNKDCGFLVLFNMDDAEINFKFSDNNKIFPPSLTFNNKTFYFIVINCNNSQTASKTKTTVEIEVTETELTKK